MKTSRLKKELELEAAGVKFSEINEEDKKSHSKNRRELPTKKLMKKELKKIMMSNKQKKLFKKMQYGIEKKENRENN